MSLEPVVIKFQLDDTALQSGADRLKSLGQIDDQTADSFKKTNAALQERSTIINDNIKASTQLSANINEQQAIYNKLVASVRNLSGASKEAVQQLLKLTPGDIAEGFKQVGISVDDYVNILDEANKGSDEFVDSQDRLTAQLNLVKNELAALGPLTKDNAAQFAELASKGGEIQEALNQTRGVIKDLGSEAPILTATTQIIRGLAGAFEAGAAGISIFGEENKDLEATMVKIFQITALVQGVQEALNLVNTKGAFTTLQLAIANRAAAINEQLLSAAESQNIIVSKAATVAQYALNLAMSLNPVGLLVIGLTAAIGALFIFANRTKEAREEQEKLNVSLQNQALLDEHIQNLNNNTEQLVSQLQARNAKETEITKAQADNIREIIADRNEKIAADQKIADDLQAKVDETNRSGKREKLQKDLDEVNARIKTNQKDVDDNFQKLLLSGIAFDKQTALERLQIAKDTATAELDLTIEGSKANFAAKRVEAVAGFQQELKLAGDNEGKIALVKAEFAKKQRDIDAAEEAQAAADRLAREQINLIQIQTVSRRINSQISEEESLQQDQILKTQAANRIAILQKQAEQDKTFRQEAAIQTELIQDQLDQQLEENARQRQIRRLTQANEDAIAVNNIALASVQTTNKQRLALEIENEQDQRAIALTNTSLTENEKQAIIAQSEEKIRQIRIAAAEKELEDELAVSKARGQTAVAETQRQLDAQAQIRQAGTRGGAVALQLGVPVLNIDEQKAKIDELTQIDLDANAKRIQSNANLFSSQLISQEEFNKNDALLAAESERIFQEGENKKRQAMKETADFQREQQNAIIQAVAQSAQQVVGFINEVFQAQDQAEQNRLDAKKARIQEELDAGAITAKRAAEQNKELDAQQKQLQRDQARRQKEIALFTAIINTASAVAVALTGGPIAGVIAAAAAAAIGAAEIALISSTPLPTFFKGKNMDKAQRDSYEGWGKIGERGAELWKSGSEMKLAERESIVWLKKDDIVYTPAQTAAFMAGSHMNAKIPVQIQRIRDDKPQFDYKRLAEEIKKRPTILNIDGYKEFIQTEKDFTEILKSRRGWL